MKTSGQSRNPLLSVLALVAVMTATLQPVHAIPHNIYGPMLLQYMGKTAQATDDDFNAQFEQIWTTVRDHFWDKQLGGLDWKKVGDTYRAKLPSVKTRAEFTDLVNAMLDELHASHTEYFTDDDFEFYMLPEVMRQDMEGHQVEHIGVMGHRSGGEFLVSGVMDGSPAQQAGIHCGDRILSADGQLFTTAGSFRGKAGKAVSIVLKPEGEEKTRVISVTPVRQNILRAFLDATDKSARIIEINGKKIGYVHLWTMANDNFKNRLDRLVEGRLHDTDGLILDLRDGYGGIPFGYTDVFYRPDVAWETQSHGQEPYTSHLGYGKPMVALINAGTRSAKEFFTYQLKITHRALIVGKPTAGAFLGAGEFDIGKTGMLEMAILGLKVDGKRLEANSVTPDVDVATQGAYTDRDQQMKVAEDKLLERIKLADRSIATKVESGH